MTGGIENCSPRLHLKVSTRDERNERADRVFTWDGRHARTFQMRASLVITCRLRAKIDACIPNVCESLSDLHRSIWCLHTELTPRSTSELIAACRAFVNSSKLPEILCFYLSDVGLALRVRRFPSKLLDTNGSVTEL